MSFLRRLFGGGRSVNPVYLNMRKIVLTIDPASQGIAPSAELPNVYGACLDWAVDDGVASVACLADGSTSLYTSFGGGIIGGGTHAPVIAANRRLLVAIERALDAFEPVTEAPLPAPGELALVACTYGGWRRATGSAEELSAGRHRAAAAFAAAQLVIGALREVEAARPA